MADVMPNIRLSQALLFQQIAEQNLAIAKARAAIVELADRRERNRTNIRAALSACDELKAQMQNAANRVEAQRLKMQYAAQQHTIERQTLENLEGVDRVLKHEEIIEGSRKALAAYRDKLKLLDDAHGPLTESVYQALRNSVFEEA